MADRFSSKAVLEAGVWTWSLFTMLTPMAAQSGIWPLLLARFLTGIGEGAHPPFSRNTALVLLTLGYSRDIECYNVLP